jgi:hypothetical protein
MFFYVLAAGYIKQAIHRMVLFEYERSEGKKKGPGIIQQLNLYPSWPCKKKRGQYRSSAPSKDVMFSFQPGIS